MSGIGNFLRGASEHITYELKCGLRNHQAIKFLLVAYVTFSKPTDEDAEIGQHFSTNNQILLTITDIEQSINSLVPRLEEQIDEFTKKGSGWVVNKIEFLDIKVVEYSPLQGSSYIPLPDFIAKKQAIINFKNDDNKCFTWCIFSALHPIHKNSDRTSSYEKYIDELDFTDLQFPMELNKIPKFEELNGLRINVYEYKKQCLPLYLTADRSSTNVIHLFAIQKANGQYHYCSIKNLSRLLSARNRHSGRSHHCPFCLFGFQSKLRLANHLPLCQGDLQLIKMPAPGSTLRFKNIKNQLRCPTVVYADCEAIMRNIDTCQPNPDSSYTTKVQDHIPCGACAYGVRKCCGESELDEILKADVSPNCIEGFLDVIIAYGAKFQEQIDNAKPMNLTPKDNEDFKNSQICHICQLGFNDGGNGECIRVRDHCHICGEYRGAAHQM